MDVTIRPATMDDLPGVCSLLEQLWPNKKSNRDALSQVFARALYSGEDYLCAELDGRIAGFCATMYVNSLWQESRIAYVLVLVVDENLRSRGIGTKLLDVCGERARHAGCTKLELDCGFHRERAHQFYERVGLAKRAFLFSKDL